MAESRAGLALQVYWRLPVRVQEAALSVYARRLDRLYFGSAYHRWLDEFRGMRWWSPTQLREWQAGRLAHVLRTAARHVPYYTERIELGEGPFDALAALPLLDRHRVRGRESDFVDRRLDRKRLFTDKTSGSTGTSLVTYWTPEAQQMLWAAFEVYVRNAAGVSRAVPRAMMGGRPIVRGDATGPLWRYNARWRQLYLSSYHVSPATAPGYVEAVRRHRSEWLTGYGSAIAALAESALERGLDPLPLRCVVVSGDTLQPGMRRSIESFFQCRCYDSYGQVEGVAMAMECSAGRLHVVPVVGVVEIVAEDGTACGPGEVGEIVATGLLNDAMPLLRYRTGDMAAWAAEPACGCGAAGRVVERLEGRTDDYLVTGDGHRVGRLSTAMKRSPSIHSAQIVQRTPGRATLLVRPDAGYRRAHAEAVRNDVLERIGAFELDIVEVAHIPTTPKGKTNLVVRLDEHPDWAPLYDALGLADE